MTKNRVHNTFLHVKMRIARRYGVDEFTRQDYDLMNQRFKSGMNLRGRTRDYNGNEYAWVLVRDVWVLAYYNTKTQIVASVYPKIETPCPDKDDVDEEGTDLLSRRDKAMCAEGFISAAVFMTKEEMIETHEAVKRFKGSFVERFAKMYDYMSLKVKSRRKRNRMVDMMEPRIQDLLDAMNIVAEQSPEEAAKTMNRVSEQVKPSGLLNRKSMDSILDTVNATVNPVVTKPAKVVRMVSLKGKTHAATPTMSEEAQ